MAEPYFISRFFASMDKRWYVSQLLMGIVIWVVTLAWLLFPSLQEVQYQLEDRRWWSQEDVGLDYTTSWDDISFSTDAKISAIFEILDLWYVDHQLLDLEKMQDNAVKGFVEALGDPHTEYLTKKENSVFTEGMQWSQHFEGIGAVVSKKKDGVMIGEVLKWSPAFAAWLKPLDLILTIDGESTQALDLSEAVERIRWPKGTTVMLGIFREDEGEPTLIDVEVTRNTIDVPSVEASLLSYSGKQLLDIEVWIFGEDTIVKLREVIMWLTGQYEGVLLDLRGNGWWYLPTAIALASFFLPKNEIVTTAQYVAFPEEVLRSEGYGDFLWYPTVVLVDEMSASASEIVAWALQQRAGAILVGKKTFGKWSIQTLQEFVDGSMLKYSIGKRYLPNGQTIDKEWITPDREVDFDSELYLSWGIDTQLQQAQDVLVQRIWALEQGEYSK